MSSSFVLEAILWQQKSFKSEHHRGERVQTHNNGKGIEKLSDTLSANQDQRNVLDISILSHLGVVIVDGVERSLIFKTEDEYHCVHPRGKLNKENQKCFKDKCSWYSLVALEVPPRPWLVADSFVHPRQSLFWTDHLQDSPPAKRRIHLSDLYTIWIINNLHDVPAYNFLWGSDEQGQTSHSRGFPQCQACLSRWCQEFRAIRSSLRYATKLGFNVTLYLAPFGWVSILESLQRNLGRSLLE